MTSCDGFISIQSISSFATVFLFPTAKGGPRDIEFPAGFCDPEMSCLFKYYELKPYLQFFPGFFVRTILLSEDMTYYNHC